MPNLVTFTTDPGPARPDAAAGSLESLLAKASGDGLDLEQMMERDTALQRRVALLVRRQNIQLRRQQIRAAAEKMEEAANWRLGSAGLSCLVGIGAAVAGACDKTAGAIGQGVAAGVEKFNPLDFQAAGCDGKVKGLELGSSEAGEGVKGADDWTGSARDLERRLVDRLEQLDRTEHELRQSILR